MRTLTFDQYEFDPMDGEEGLEVSIATKRDSMFADLLAFAVAALGPWAPGKPKLPPAVTFHEQIGPGNVRAYLKRYAGVTLPTPCDWPIYVVSDDRNDWDALLVGPEMRIRYHWWTTA